MRIFKLLVIICLILSLFVSCQTTGSSNINRNSPDYAEGKELGKKMAKEHRNKIDDLTDEVLNALEKTQ